MGNKYTEVTSRESLTPRISFAKHIVYGTVKPTLSIINMYRSEVLDDDKNIMYPEVKLDMPKVTGIYFGYTLSLKKRVDEETTIESTHSFSREYAKNNGLIELAQIVDTPSGKSRTMRTPAGIFTHNDLRKKDEAGKADFAYCVHFWLYDTELNRPACIKYTGSCVVDILDIISKGDGIPEGIITVGFSKESRKVGGGKASKTIFKPLIEKKSPATPEINAIVDAHHAELVKYSNPTIVAPETISNITTVTNSDLTYSSLNATVDSSTDAQKITVDDFMDME